MTVKRKLEVDQEDVMAAYSRPMKQRRGFSFQFPPVQCQDVAMSDASSSPTSPADPTSLSFGASQSSSYPTFNLYPFPSYGPGDVEMGLSMDTPASSVVDSRTSSNASDVTSSVGLLQPKSSFVHNL